MTAIIEGNQTIENNEDIVVLLIGARVNRWWLLPLALPVVSKMSKMLGELEADPESGLLGFQPFGLGGMAQYWKSLDHLLAYANSKKHTHRPTAKRYYQKVFKNQAVGVWHECFHVPAGHYEALYSNMPAYGLGQFKPRVAATGQHASARWRLRAAFETESHDARNAQSQHADAA